jgi:dTDP-4-dehydrorhamnose reductase
VAAALARHHQVIGLDRHPWWGDQPMKLLHGDLMDPEFRRASLEEARPEIFIHCAAMVNVDACEEMPEVAYAANGALTGQLARAMPRDCLFVYVTTDGVFRGDRPFMREEDLPCPRTVYGRSKLHGEWETELTTDNHIIVRTNFFGWSSGLKQTSAEWLFGALSTGASVTLFDDFFFTPLYVVDLVERLVTLIGGGHRGRYHVCGRDRVSKHEFGMGLAAVAGLSTGRVQRGSIEAATLKAPRPRDMSLHSERFEKATGLLVPRCEDGLRRFIADRGRPLSERVAAVSQPF